MGIGSPQAGLMRELSDRRRKQTLPYRVLLTTDDRQRAADFITDAWKHGHYTGTRWVNTAALDLVEVNPEAQMGRVIRTANRYAVVERGIPTGDGSPAHREVSP